MIDWLEQADAGGAPVDASNTEAVKNRLDERCEKVFKEMDLDGSGNIDLSELTTAAKKIGLELSPEEVEEMLATADHDDDKTISLPEFKHLMEHEWELYHKKVDPGTCICTIL